jgi:predicted nucleic acid-binding protein
MVPSPALVLPAEAMSAIVERLCRAGVTGGATYDGLIALTAAAHGARLLSVDRRARETYSRCGVDCRLLQE